MKAKTFLAQKDFALESVIEKISDDEKLLHYKNYCKKRLDGLRKEAFAELNVFLKDFASAIFEQKKRLVAIVLGDADSFGEDLAFDTMPHPLNEQIIKPTLERALSLNPREQKPLLLFIERNINALFYSTHHLPDYYCGNLGEDMLLLNKVEEKIRLLDDGEVKSAITDNFLFFKTLICNYFDFLQSGEKDFAAWGAKNGKQISSNVASYYYN